MFRLFFAICLVFSSVIKADATKLIFAFSPDPPYSYIDEQQKPAGMEVELVQLIAEHAGIELIYITCPFSRCLKMIERGEADLIASVIKTDDRQAYMQFVEPAYYRLQSSYAFYTSSSSEIQLSGYSELYPLIIGHLRGAVYFPKFDRDTELKKIGVKSEALLAELLVMGRVDVGVSVEGTFDQTIMRLGFAEKIRRLDYRHKRAIGSFMALSKKSKHLHLTPRLNQAVLDKIKDGSIKAVMKGYDIDVLD